LKFSSEYHNKDNRQASQQAIRHQRHGIGEQGAAWSDAGFGSRWSLNSGGERVAVGPSGCSKSLLMRALAGLDPLDAGQVIFANRAMKVGIYRTTALGSLSPNDLHC